MKRDHGTTELIGFILILTLVFSVIAVVTAVYLPNYIEEAEQSQNDEALSAFLSFNRDLMTLCYAEEAGVWRENTLPSAALYQKTRASVTYGSTISYRGVDYRELIITYETDNIIGDDFEISVSKRGIRKNNKAFIQQDVRLVADPDDTAEQMESDSGEIRIEYMYQGNFVQSGIAYHIISVRLT